MTTETLLCLIAAVLQLGALSPHLSFNTAASFTTNTNWQSYGSETTMSYLTQMAGLTVQNFVSAAVGIALATAFIRGIARRETDALGNFWVDLTRATLYVLLPISFIVALLFVASGVTQNLWLWFTVLFANFAEAMAEGRGKAQAETLRKSRTETTANRLLPDGRVEIVEAGKLRRDDVVIVSAGEFIPGDGEVIEGVASVDESAITGESAPVIREAGGDRSATSRILSKAE